MTKEELKEIREIRRKWRNEKAEYRKTKKGFLIKLYSNMQKRVNGKNEGDPTIYEGLDLMTKEELYEFANCEEFDSLWEEYVDSGFQRKFAPSPDRLDGDKGYIQENIEWVTQSINSIRCHERRNGEY